MNTMKGFSMYQIKRAQAVHGAVQALHCKARDLLILSDRIDGSAADHGLHRIVHGSDIMHAHA
jgi:hypothetical protein